MGETLYKRNKDLDPKSVTVNDTFFKSQNISTLIPKTNDSNYEYLNQYVMNKTGMSPQLSPYKNCFRKQSRSQIQNYREKESLNQSYISQQH